MANTRFFLIVLAQFIQPVSRLQLQRPLVLLPLRGPLRYFTVRLGARWCNSLSALSKRNGAQLAAS